jgi:hypothetical protein
VEIGIVSSCYPKASFYSLAAMQDRLSTGDQLLKWGYERDVKCLFCHNQTESRDHLFFFF